MTKQQCELFGNNDGKTFITLRGAEQDTPQKNKDKWSSMIGVVLVALLGSVSYGQTRQENVSAFPEPRLANEKTELKPHVGLKGGVANPEGDFDATSEYGLEIGYQPYIPFSVGLELTTMSSNRANASNLNRTKALAKANYNFGGTTPIIRSSFVGMGLGPVVDSEGGETVFRPALGLLTGFDIPLSHTGQIVPQSFTLGANLSYLFVGNNGADTFGLNAVAKYWF